MLAFGVWNKKICVSFFGGDSWIVEEKLIRDSFEFELIDIIQKVLNQISTPITHILTTAGPSSFTQLRILISTARGLAMGFNCQWSLVRVFDLVNFISKEKNLLILLESKREDYFSQLMINDEIITENLIKEDEIQEIKNTFPDIKIIREMDGLISFSVGRCLIEYYLAGNKCECEPFYLHTPEYKKI